MVIGTSRCAHVLRYLFCCRVRRAHFECSKYSTTADVSGEPVMRNARAKARRRIAACRHCWSGCSQAPRPGRLPAASTVTAQSPFPSSQRPLEAVRRPTLASGIRRTSAPVHPYRSMRARPKSRAGSRLESTVTASRGSEPRCRRLSVARGAAGVCVPGAVGLSGAAAAIAADVDPPAGQPGRQPGVLALLADRQRQLEVGHHHPRRAGGLVDDLTPTPPWPVTARWRRTAPGPRRSR